MKNVVKYKRFVYGLNESYDIAKRLKKRQLVLSKVRFLAKVFSIFLLLIVICYENIYNFIQLVIIFFKRQFS